MSLRTLWRHGQRAGGNILRLILAKNIGFCFGVRRAIDMAVDMLKRQGKLYILGELIHNKDVIERIEPWAR